MHYTRLYTLGIRYNFFLDNFRNILLLEHSGDTNAFIDRFFLVKNNLILFGHPESKIKATKFLISIYNIAKTNSNTLGV